jgi:4-hydroxyphenylpyruvate dioxygenase-like putative hemolysin
MTATSPTGARVHHVVWCVGRESLPALERYWTDALGVPLVSTHIKELGLHLLMSWDAGVEIVAPSEEPGPITEALEAFLAAKGEGVFSTVYEVADLDVAVHRATARGAKVVIEDVIEPDVLTERMHWPADRPSYRLRQAVLEEVNGTTVCLQETIPV